MPAMIRSNLSKKIAFKIIGKPDAMQDKKSSTQKKINKVLTYQDTRLVR
jgi:hypothetical protein